MKRVLGPRKRKTPNGFTLGELLVVVLVIGILAAIAVPRLRYARERAYRNSMIADLKNLATQQEIYHIHNFTYSTDLADLGMEASTGVTLEVTEASAGGWAAVATHVAVDGKTCGIFFGDANPASGAPATNAGAIGCDFDS